MAYITKFDGQTDTTIQLGGVSKQDGKPNPTSIEGYFLGTKEIPDSGYGPGKLHIFQTSDGTIGVWGKTNSNRLLTKDLAGQMVLLTFTGMGEKKKGKNPAYMYSVQHDPNNTTDVSGIDLNSSEPESDESVESEDAAMTPANNTYSSAHVPRTVAQPARTVVAASAPSASKQAEIQALLKSRRSAAS